MGWPGDGRSLQLGLAWLWKPGLCGLGPLGQQPLTLAPLLLGLSWGRLRVSETLSWEGSS